MIFLKTSSLFIHSKSKYLQILHRSNGRRGRSPDRGAGRTPKTRGGVGTYTLYSHKNYLHTRLNIKTKSSFSNTTYTKKSSAGAGGPARAPGLAGGRWGALRGGRGRQRGALRGGGRRGGRCGRHLRRRCARRARALLLFLLLRVELKH